MSSDNWQLIQQLFHEVTEKPEAEWSTFLEKHPQFDPQVKKEVLKLLDAEKNASCGIDQVQQRVFGLLTEERLPHIEGYDVLERIAMGGMGSVYKAWDSQLSRHVAIKLLHPHRSQQSKAKQRFLREARSSAKIRHKNICPVFEISQTPEEALYIVSAFCDGVDLSQKIRNNSLNLDQILTIFEQLLSALSAAHAQGVVHRDLKPENIIVDETNHIQLVDFGIARSIVNGHDDYQTMTGEVLGTPDYMSPEQFRGEAFDHLSDIWSCGIILYEMLYGKTPYSGKTAPEIIYSMLHEIVPFSTEQKQGLSSLHVIIRQCLQIDKSLRPASADNLWSLLLQARADLHENEILDNKPAYDTNRVLAEGESLNPLTIQRQIISLKVKISAQNIDEEIINLLERCCLKFRGVVSKKKVAIQNQSHCISAYFGYPIADELKVKNAISCGLEWQAILTESGLGCVILAGFEKLVEQENKFVNDSTLQDEKWMTDFFLDQISKSGFWVMNKLSKGIPENLAVIQGSEVFSKNDSEVVCYLVKKPITGHLKSIPTMLSHFIGRDAQLSILLENWQQAIEGDQQRILVSGEAGIGKSRLIYEFKAKVESHSTLKLIELDCSAYEKSSAYYPILQYFRQKISVYETDFVQQHLKSELPKQPLQSLQQQRTKIVAYLDTQIEASETDKHLFCQLMGVELTLQEQTNLPTGDLLSRNYQNLLSRLLSAKPKGFTSLFIIEDLHWSDAATGVVLEKLLQPSSTHQSMILMSSRTEYKALWLSNIVTSNLYLSKLRQTHSEALLNDLLTGFTESRLSSSLRVSPELVQRLALKTGGNPLFIEEMAKTIVTLPDITTFSQLPIPETIQDTLIARLEKLGVAQNMAQMASVIGRDFNLVLLRTCRNESESEFKQQLHTLIQADILHHVGGGDHYRFKHALIRDAAYQMLTPESRQTLHKVIATTLEKQFSETISSQPELLAQHWEAAQRNEQAVRYWLLAAQRNLQLSAITECLAQCDHAIQLVSSSQSSLKKSKYNTLLLSAYMIQGPALMARHGYADKKVKQVYKLALKLCEKTNSPESTFPVLFGLWTYHCVKAHHKIAAGLAQHMVVLSSQLTSLEKCEAHMVSGITKYYRGQFVPAQKEFVDAFEYYDEKQAQQHILLFGQDPGVVIQSYQAWNESMLGNISAAHTFSLLAVKHAHQLQHPFTLTYALSFSGWLNLNCGQIDEADLLINESIEICQQHEIAVFLGLSQSLLALVLFSKNEVEQGFSVMSEAEENYLATGASLFIPGFLTAKAEVALAMQDVKKAEELLDQSLAIIEESDENWCLAPTLALRSVIYANCSEPEKAEACMLRASKILSDQNALGLKMMLKQKGLEIIP